jgi:hypothetical protein
MDFLSSFCELFSIPSQIAAGVALMSFEHPLARKAKIWPMMSQDGSERRVLVVVTTLELDPENEKHKKKLVGRLRDEAADYVAGRLDVSGYVLINPAKDWGA